MDRLSLREMETYDCPLKKKKHVYVCVSVSVYIYIHEGFPRLKQWPRLRQGFQTKVTHHLTDLAVVSEEMDATE